MEGQNVQAEVARLEPLVNNIREHLWFHPEGSRAAAFIGAGFSTNATMVSHRGKQMVLWQGVVARMLDRLEPGKLAPGFGDAALRIAQEYEAAYGRPELNRLIEDCIPDANYEPGSLHQNLLKLPWADIFTTNQDTLLERTRYFAPGRRYDVVTNVQDISATRSPRIVKLHGSLPSQRPFIFTEEDFRTYPRRFAPFVNMVQQSMMENVLCLLGFSGDDPNFLFWSGWVRDNLGEHAPQIYLIGLLDLSESKRQLLGHYNVIPIDLGAVFPATPHNNSGERHRAALGWFLKSLERGRSTDRSAWPETSAHDAAPSHEGVPLLRPHRRTTPRIDSDEVGEDQPRSLYAVYRHLDKIQESHPGWILTPSVNRRRLSFQTIPLISNYPSSAGAWTEIETLETLEAVLLASKLVWLQERRLVPLQIHEGEVIDSLIRKVNLFPEVLELTSAEIKAEQVQLPYQPWDADDIGWREVTEAWTRSAFALMTHARENVDTGRFVYWRDVLSQVHHRRVEWTARWFHETTLFYLATFEADAARKQLHDWPDTPGLPEWTLRRAALYAELTDIATAQALVDTALVQIRQGQRHDREDRYYLSLESWALISRFYYRNELSPVSQQDDDADSNARNSDRLEALKAFQCDPWGECRELSHVVQGPQPQPQLADRRVVESVGFDPGVRHVTRHIGFSTDHFDKILPAFALLKLPTEAGYPLRFPHVITLEGVGNAAEWIWTFSPLWSISTYLRAGRNEEFRNWFGRARVATLSDEQVAKLLEMFSKGIRDGIAELQGAGVPRRTYAHHIFSNLIEALSRLCFLLNAKQLDQVAEIALTMYHAKTIQEDYAYYGGLAKLFERLLMAMSAEDKKAFLPKLLKLPYVSEDLPDRVDVYLMWPEPTLSLRPGSISTISQTDPIFDEVRSHIPIFLEQVRTGGLQERSRALWRLLLLDGCRVLDAQEKAKLADAVWSRTHTETGLPSETNLTLASVLSLPQPEPNRAETVLRAHLRNREIPPVSTLKDGSWSSAGGAQAGNNLLMAWLAGNALPGTDKNGTVNWNAEDVEVLIQQLDQWSRTEANHKREGFTDFLGDLSERFEIVDRLLEQVVFPRVNLLSDQARRNLQALMAELQTMGFELVVALPASLNLRPDDDEASRVENRLRQLLSTYKPQDVQGALDAVYSWAYLSHLDIIPPVPSGLVRELANKIFMRRNPGLISAINIISQLNETSPSLITHEVRHDLLSALEHLLSEVELPDLTGIDSASDQTQVFSLEERPDAFVTVSKLAAAIQTLYLSEGSEVPEVLEMWQQKAEESKLPEVRAVYKNISLETKRHTLEDDGGG